MVYRYRIHRLLITFEDVAGSKIGEHEYPIDSNAVNLPSFAAGHRIELAHEGVTIIGTVRDVKHWIQADGTGDLAESVSVMCTASYLP